mmetsp:Transcript_56842/g.184137  ORF Transcript_56842/g.184137 Transcript_56842/m.184137 type:complete len:409 (-) Transcript_56842:158-1384(-)
MSPADHSTTIPKLHSQTCARDIDDESDISTQRGSQSSVCFDSDMSFGPMELGRKSSAEFASASTTGSWCPPGIGSFDSDTELQFTQFSRMLRPSSLEPLPAAEGFGHTSLIAATEAEATGCAHLIAVAASAAQRTAQRTARRSRFLNTPAVEPGRVHAAADVVTTAIVASENSVPVGRAHVTAAGATGALLTVRGRANVIAEDTAAMASNEDIFALAQVAEASGHVHLIAAAEAEAPGRAHLTTVAAAARAARRMRYLGTHANTEVYGCAHLTIDAADTGVGRPHVTADVAATAVVAPQRAASVDRAHITADVAATAVAASQCAAAVGRARVFADIAATAATASERAPAIGRTHVTAGAVARAVVASLRFAAIGRAHATADITTMAAAASQRVISTGNAEESATTVGF